MRAAVLGDDCILISRKCHDACILAGRGIVKVNYLAKDVLLMLTFKFLQSSQSVGEDGCQYWHCYNHDKLREKKFSKTHQGLTQ